MDDHPWREEATNMPISLKEAEEFRERIIGTDGGSIPIAPHRQTANKIVISIITDNPEVAFVWGPGEANTDGPEGSALRVQFKDYDGASATTIEALSFLVGVADTLLSKGKAYGDAADFRPVFSRGLTALTVLETRIDQKLRRIAEVGWRDSGAEDSILDLVGYLALAKALRRQEEERDGA